MRARPDFSVEAAMRMPVSLRIARWLVCRYPASFRQRYGDEIEVALERSIRERRLSGRGIQRC